MGTLNNQAMWDERREWLQKFAQSSLSLAQFCRDNQLNPVNVRAWRRKLGPMAVRQSVAAKKKSKFAGPYGLPFESPSQASAFVQWQAPAQSSLARLSSAQPSSPWVEISMADGMLIRVPASNLTALDKVLTAVNSSHHRTMDRGAQS